MRQDVRIAVRCIMEGEIDEPSKNPSRVRYGYLCRMNSSLFHTPVTLDSMTGWVLWLWLSLVYN